MQYYNKKILLCQVKLYLFRETKARTFLQGPLRGELSGPTGKGKKNLNRRLNRLHGFHGFFRVGVGLVPTRKANQWTSRSKNISRWHGIKIKNPPPTGWVLASSFHETALLLPHAHRIRHNPSHFIHVKGLLQYWKRGYPSNASLQFGVGIGRHEDHR